MTSFEHETPAPSLAALVPEAPDDPVLPPEDDVEALLFDVVAVLLADALLSQALNAKHAMKIPTE